ncbi:MAG: cell wall-active antibiotics response protein [Candidatus Aminicenantes bacterium]|nr:cell wall-active antibiotics response protein [Candidatus Aminicenantes bacterium]MDH5744470.1 cell wall-active antibiotics response protein [Candidatus Aminicenantes bacterium]
MNHFRTYQGRIFSGLLIIAIGVIFLLANMDRLDFGDFISTYWPMILIFIGLWHLLSSGFRNAGFPLVLIVVGLFFQLNNWDVISGSVWTYFWPLLIIAAGLWIIFKPKHRVFSDKAPEIKSDDIGAFIIFSGLKRRFESEKFRGGKATVIFGGIDLDLTQTKLVDNQATVELTAIFGGINLFVPRDWKVVVDSSSILGGVDDKHSPIPATAVQATLYVKATAILGGIDIKN